MTIDQYAIVPSLSIGIATTGVYWLCTLDWEAMGRLKLPLLGTVLAIGIAIHQVQRYLKILQQRREQQLQRNR
jgi:hypothetical protein